MRKGQFVVAALVLSAALAGAGMWYTQTRAYYAPVDAASDAAIIKLTTFEGLAEPLLIEGFDGLDSFSSPIRYRACFTTPISLPTLTETFQSHPAPNPLIAPGWFSCFDAEAIGEALEAGTALAFMGEENIQYGIDRVVVIDGEGRGYAWQQINPCGEAAFAGDPLPEGCPAQEEEG